MAVPVQQPHPARAPQPAVAPQPIAAEGAQGVEGEDFRPAGRVRSSSVGWGLPHQAEPEDKLKRELRTEDKEKLDPRTEEKLKPEPHTAPAAVDGSGTRREPVSRIRKRIAENLVRAQHTAAILTTFNEIDMSEIVALRNRHKEQFEKTHGVGLGFMSFFARACVFGLREFPRPNAFYEGEEIVYHNYLHLGIAVSTDRGLAVPVLRHVETMGFARIEAEIKRLANATREGKLKPDELSGGTFTITNGGVFGSLLSTPILNPPQSAILGLHAIQKRPVAIDDRMEIRPMMYVALSYDHRLIDGRESVSFLVRIKQLLEDPARMLLGI